jgi:hypothetical protein
LIARASLVGVLVSGGLSCGEDGSLAISAGAPVTAVVRGTITDCGRPVANAEVQLHVQQDEPEQVRPVDVRIGPVTTSRSGTYIADVGAPFAVPGPASVELRITTGGVTKDISGGTLQLQLGQPVRDTTRIDADLGAEREVC